MVVQNLRSPNLHIKEANKQFDLLIVRDTRKQNILQGVPQLSRLIKTNNVAVLIGP